MVGVHKGVPPKIRRANPLEAHWIESSLMFRSAVLQEFNRLVREGIHVTDLPQVEQAALEPLTEAMAFAPT